MKNQNKFFPKISVPNYLSQKQEQQIEFKKKIIDSLINKDNQSIYNIRCAQKKEMKEIQNSLTDKNKKRQSQQRLYKIYSFKNKSQKKIAKRQNKNNYSHNHFQILEAVQIPTFVDRSRSGSRLKLIKNKFQYSRNLMSKNKAHTLQPIQEYLPFDENKHLKNKSYKKSKILKLKTQNNHSLQFSDQSYESKEKFDFLLNIRRAKAFKNNLLLKNSNECIRYSHLHKRKNTKITEMTVLKGWEIQEQNNRYQI